MLKKYIFQIIIRQFADKIRELENFFFLQQDRYKELTTCIFKIN